LLAACFAAALVMLAAAAVAAVAYLVIGDPRLRWLALHLALLGGVSQLIVGASQFFVCAFLATTPPMRRTVALQLAAWNAGMVAVGVPCGVRPLVDAGAVLIACGLALLAVSLRAMRRRSLQRARWAVHWYEACAASLALGVLVGALLARGTPWPHGSLLGVHLALNVGGWLGCAIVGTLHTFFPSLTATRLRFARLQGPSFVLWLVGVGALALGAGLTSNVAAVAGWLALTSSALLLSVNVAASLQARTIALSLAARLVAIAQAFLPLGLALALIATLAGGADAPFASGVRAPLAVLLLAGWIGLTVAGSLIHLLAVLARVRNLTAAMPAPRQARDRALTALAAAAVATWALAAVPGLAWLDGVALALRVGVTFALGVRIAPLALQAATAPRRHPRPI
jgi:nitrite reductase (NO-forming)